MEILLILSREHQTLPKAEALATLESENIDCTVKWAYDGILILEIGDQYRHLVDTVGRRMAYIHEICELLVGADVTDFSSLVNKYSWKNIIDSDFAVRVKVINGGDDFDSQDMEWKIGGIIKRKLGDNATVNLDDPSTFIRVVFTEEKVLIGERLIKKDKKHFFELKPHKRPFFYPGSMSPKLARGMVNFSRIKKGDLVLDPFCGTGGILIEAGIIGVRLIGLDIDEKMVKGTIENLEFCGINDYEVFQGDARNIEIPSKVDAVITDPPYGISASTAGEESTKLYRDAISSMEKVVKDRGHVCMATPHYLDIHKLVGGTKFKIIEQHEIRMHKSLTRVISVLEKH